MNNRNFGKKAWQTEVRNLDSLDSNYSSRKEFYIPGGGGTNSNRGMDEFMQAETIKLKDIGLSKDSKAEKINMLEEALKDEVLRNEEMEAEIESLKEVIVAFQGQENVKGGESIKQLLEQFFEKKQNTKEHIALSHKIEALEDLQNNKDEQILALTQLIEETDQKMQNLSQENNSLLKKLSLLDEEQEENQLTINALNDQLDSKNGGIDSDRFRKSVTADRNEMMVLKLEMENKNLKKTVEEKNMEIQALLDFKNGGSETVSVSRRSNVNQNEDNDSINSQSQVWKNIEKVEVQETQRNGNKKIFLIKQQ